MEHILINLSVLPSEGRIQLPVWELPGIHQSDGVWTHFGHQGHNCLGADKLNLLDRQRTRRVELRGADLQSVKRKEAEERVHDSDGLRIQLVGERLGLQGVVKVLDNQVLRVGSRQAPEVDEEGVPRALLHITVLQRLKGEVRSPPCESGDDVCVRRQDIERTALVLGVEESAENGGSVVNWCLALQDCACGLEQVAGHLLRQHIVVALPSGGWEVVGVPGPDAGELGVSMATHSSATGLETLCSDARAQGLETAGCGVEIGKVVGGGSELLWSGTALGVRDCVLHFLLVGFVHAHHCLAGIMECESGCQERQEAVLHHGVVEHLVLSRVVREVVAVLELATDGAVACCDCDTSCQNGAGLKDDGGAHPGHCSIGESRVEWAHELARLLVDGGVAGQHVYMGNLEVVEEEEAVIHGVVTELWPDISDVDALQWLVGLEVANLGDEWVRAVGLSVQDELSHDDGVGGCATEGTDPPFCGGEVGGVQDEGLVGWVPGCGCLQTADVGAVAELGLGVAADVAVVLCWLEKELLLLWGGLVLESGLGNWLAYIPATSSRPHIRSTYHEHRGVKTIWSWLRDERIGDLVILKIPLVLNLKLSHALGSSEGDWELLDSAHEVVLALVEDRLPFEDGEDLGLALKVVRAKHIVGELVDIDIGLSSLLGEELAALWSRRNELLDPFRFLVWRHCVCVTPW